MSQTVSLRLPDETAEWLRRAARRTGHSVNELGVRIVEESRRSGEFAEIEFRSFNGERHACIKGQLQVWQLIEVARQYDMDAERTAAHFGWPTWKVTAAFHYYEVFSEEIDQAIAENESMGFDKLKRLFPQMSLVRADMDQANIVNEQVNKNDAHPTANRESIENVESIENTANTENLLQDGTSDVRDDSEK